MQKVIEMALKSLFLPQNYKIHSAAGGSAARPLCDTLELHRFVQHGPKLDNFWAKIIYLWFNTPLLAKSWLRAFGHTRSCRQTFEAIIRSTYETSR